MVVQIDGPARLCRTDEVGEICVSGASVATGYWGLKGVSNHIYKVQPLNLDNTVFNPDVTYVRSGLLGFLGPVS